MELTVFERVTLLDILPNQGDYASLKLVRQLREDLSLEDVAEAISLQVNQVDSRALYAWDGDAAAKVIKNVELLDSSKVKRLIKSRFKELDERKLLTMDHLPLYERFIPEED